MGQFTYLAAKDNSTIDVAGAAVPGWKVPMGAEAEKSAIYKSQSFVSQSQNKNTSVFVDVLFYSDSHPDLVSSR